VRLDEIRRDLNRTNFSTYSAAVQHARLDAEKKGFDISDDAWFSHVNNGPRKPADGETVRLEIPLEKDGKEVPRILAIQVYNRGTDTVPFELNHYVS
jgi:hypothetical protein